MRLKPKLLRLQVNPAHVLVWITFPFFSWIFFTFGFCLLLFVENSFNNFCWSISHRIVSLENSFFFLFFFLLTIFKNVPLRKFVKVTVISVPFCISECSLRLRGPMGASDHLCVLCTLFLNKPIPFVTSSASPVLTELNPFPILTCSQICVTSFKLSMYFPSNENETSGNDTHGICSWLWWKVASY